MTKNDFSYATRIGNTTFIVNVKQSESAKKPLDTVFQEICRHEVLGDFSTDNSSNLEKLPKSS
ncbi:transposon-encoded TnpW family protein [Sellimonas caecigallum]|uniref:Transposase n=1 Tax=Sellimonas caecigallum TaxID=2592333 RepID=A0ABS7L808_9FIRM|nr:transposon-encoded TnpW family protein [Sellimonas caecigallum]MBY0758930.1 transposase [Sellimonas caecigallum]